MVTFVSQEKTVLSASQQIHTQMSQACKGVHCSHWRYTDEYQYKIYISLHIGHSTLCLALSGKVRESQVWILHTYGLQNLRNSQMQSWAKCNARGHSHFSPGVLKVQGCVVPARSNFRINLHITRQRKRNSYFPNGDVGILPPPGRWYNIKGGKAKRMGGPIS